MRCLYIIGNGFDLAHDLKTSYWAFRTFLEKIDYEFLDRFEKMYGYYQPDFSEYGCTEATQKKWEDNLYSTLWKDFEKRIGEPDFDDMISYSDSVVADLDLESGPINIKDTLDEYWKREYHFITKFNNYVKEWVETIDLSKASVKNSTLENNETDLFLTFNYTDTLEKIYNIDRYNILHIHGGLSDNSNYLPVMGHGNTEMINYFNMKKVEAEEEYDEGNASICEAIEEYLLITQKDTEEIIKKNNYFFSKLADIQKVIVFGVSFGNVDIPYLCKIKECTQESVQWEFYYHTDADLNNLKNVCEISNISLNKVKFIKSDCFWD